TVEPVRRTRLRQPRRLTMRRQETLVFARGQLAQGGAVDARPSRVVHGNQFIAMGDARGARPCVWTCRVARRVSPAGQRACRMRVWRLRSSQVLAWRL